MANVNWGSETDEYEKELVRETEEAEREYAEERQLTRAAEQAEQADAEYMQAAEQNNEVAAPAPSPAPSPAPVPFRLEKVSRSPLKLQPQMLKCSTLCIGVHEKSQNVPNRNACLPS
jgi:hypothetical protein